MSILYIFWIAFFLILYTYIGYGIVIKFLLVVKNLFKNTEAHLFEDNELPALTLIVASYNEEDIIVDKI